MAEPVPPLITAFFTGKILIEGPGCRITDEHQFDTASRTQARDNLRLIMEARRRLFAAGFKVKRAHVSLNDATRDAKNLFPVGMTAVQISTDAAGPPVVIEPCNNPSVGFLFRFQATNGRHSQRLIRGVRDGWIAGNAPVIATVDVNALPYNVGGPYLGGNPPVYDVGGVGSDTPTDLLQNYLSLVRDLSKLIRPEVGTPGSYRAFPYKFHQYEDVRTHDVGVATAVPRGRQHVWS